MTRLAIGVAAMGALAGCSGVAVLNTLQPKGGVAVERDIAYRPGAHGMLDIYRPAQADGQEPVVVFLYGGGWDSGTKAIYAFVGNALAREGLVVVIPDYRYYPEVRWPVFLQDNAEAVAWTKAHAAEHGGDPQRLFLMGHSAGAYNAVELAVDRRWLSAVGMDANRDLKGVIGLAGPYDFLPLHSDELRIIFGPEAQRPDTQPINHVEGPAPPTFLGTDVKDKVVDPGNTARMAAKLRAAGTEVETRDYTGVNHALLAGALSAPLRFLTPVFADVTRFIQAHAAPVRTRAAA